MTQLHGRFCTTFSAFAGDGTSVQELEFHTIAQLQRTLANLMEIGD